MTLLASRRLRALTRHAKRSGEGGDEAAKPDAHRDAAQRGIDAFDRSEFKEFPDAAALQA